MPCFPVASAMASYFILMQLRAGVTLTGSEMVCSSPAPPRSCVLAGRLMLTEEDVPELETALCTHQGP